MYNTQYVSVHVVTIAIFPLLIPTDVVLQVSRGHIAGGHTLVLREWHH